MDLDYTYVQSLDQEVEIPKNGILSRSLFSDDHIKVSVFGFDAGQELSTHTASTSAIIHIIRGTARLTLGKDVMEVNEGAWTRMPPGLEHALWAITPFVMLLIT